MRFIKVSKMIHLSSVRRVFYKIFPEEKGRNNCEAYLDSIKGNLNGLNRLEYYLITDKLRPDDLREVVGLTGMYSENNDEAWLGWFGVNPKFRCQGYGKEILEWTLRKMKEYGYKTVLLYTEEDVNKEACKLYKKLGFIRGKTYELDRNDEENKDIIIIGDYQDKKIITKETIYFRSLTNEFITEWNGKPIF